MEVKLEPLSEFPQLASAGNFGIWLTVVMFWFRNEFNHKKMRSDSEDSVRQALMKRVESLELSGAAERAACQQETRDLRLELAQINQRFMDFQLAVMKQATPSKLPGVLQHALESLAHPPQAE